MGPEQLVEVDKKDKCGAHTAQAFHRQDTGTSGLQLKKTSDAPLHGQDVLKPSGPYARASIAVFIEITALWVRTSAAYHPAHSPAASIAAWYAPPCSRTATAA
jgi:hypothetical protein